MEEIKTFMINKGKDVSFKTKYHTDLNVKLERNGQFVSTLYEHDQTFILKLKLIQKKLILRKFSTSQG